MVDFSKLSADELEALLKERRAQEAREREEKRKAYEGLRDETVEALCKEAKSMSDVLANFKNKAFAEMQSLHALLIEHSNRHANGKGNFTVANEADTMKIEYKYQENGKFDERSKEAEAHIIDFVNRHFEGQTDTQELITKLLERKAGQLDVKLVQKLYGMEDRFDDAAWREGIRLLKESWKPTDTKVYINFYERDERDEWRQISLNFSAV